MSLPKQFLLTLFLPLILLIATASWLGYERLQKQEYQTISEAMLAQTRQHAERLGKQLADIASRMHTAKLLLGKPPAQAEPLNTTVRLWMQRQIASQAWVNGIGITRSDAQFKAQDGLWLTRTLDTKTNKPAMKHQAQPRAGINAWLTELKTQQANLKSKQSKTSKTNATPPYLQGYWTPPYRDDHFAGDLLVSYVLPITYSADKPAIQGLLHIDIALNRLLASTDLRPQGYINQLLEPTERLGSKQTSKNSAPIDWILLSRQGLYLYSRFDALIGQSIFDLAAAIKRPDLGRLAEFAVRGGSGFFELPAWSTKSGPSKGTAKGTAEGQPKSDSRPQWITVAPVPGTSWSYGQSLTKPVAPLAHQAGRLLTIGLPGVLLLFAIIGLLVSGVLRQRLLDLARKLSQADTIETTNTRRNNEELELLTHAAQAFSQTLTQRQQQILTTANGEHQQQLNEQLSQQQADSEQQQSALQSQFAEDESERQAQLQALQQQLREQQQQLQAAAETNSQQADVLANTEQQRDDLQVTISEISAQRETETAQHQQELAKLSTQAADQTKALSEDFEQKQASLRQKAAAEHAESQQTIAEQDTHIGELQHHQAQLQQQNEGLNSQLTLISQARDIGLWRVNTTTFHSEALQAEEGAAALHMQGSILQRLGLDPQNPPNTVAAWLKTIHESDSSRAFASFSDWITGNDKHFHLKYTAVTRSGETLPVEARGQKLHNNDGTLIEVVGTLVDLSLPEQAKLDIERTEQQRQQWQQTQHTLASHLHNGPSHAARIQLQSLYQLEFPGSDLHSSLASTPQWQAIKWQTQQLQSQLDNTIQWLEKNAESEIQDTELAAQPVANFDEEAALPAAFDPQNNTLAGRKLLLLDSQNERTEAYLSNLNALGLDIIWLQDNASVCEHLEVHTDTSLLIRLDNENIDIEDLFILLAADPATAQRPVIGLTDNPNSEWHDQPSHISALLTEPVDYTTWISVLNATLPKQDNQHTNNGIKLPTMAGIDTQVGLKNHQGDTAQYLDSLNAFATEHAAIANQLEQALIQGDKQQSIQLSEELRNNAEAIGANMLFETLKALNNVIQRCRDKAEVQVISLAPTHAALRHVSSSIVALAQPSVTPRVTTSKNSIDPEQFSHRFRDLSLLLHDKEPAASACLEAIRSRFGDSEHSQDLDLIAGHIENEDYAAASRVLAGIMAGLDIV